MLYVAIWIMILFVPLFFLGCAVGSFLNVCIVRLPQGRSLIRPPSCCGQCGTAIRWQDNIPLLSYCRLRGRCRACGTPFSMRYFWIELLTGLVFVLIYYLEIGRNLHHFQALPSPDEEYVYILMQMFRLRPWLLFTVHALLSCFLIVATVSNHEHHRVPRCVTYGGVLLGLLAAVFFPWPWPDESLQAVTSPDRNDWIFVRDLKATVWGKHLGSMPPDAPWWKGDITPREGMYPWPVWGPLPEWLPLDSYRFGLATGLCGLLTGAFLVGLVRMVLNSGVGTAALGWGEMSLMMIAGAFLGWQPIVVAVFLGLIPGLVAATAQWSATGQTRISISLWLALAVAGVWLGWYWIGPLVQGVFFHPTRLLLLFALWTGSSVVLSIILRLTTLIRPPPHPSMSPQDSTQQPSREMP